MLAYVIVRDFLLDGFSNAWTVKMLANQRLRSIYYKMKEIRVIPFTTYFWSFCAITIYLCTLRVL